MELKNLEGFFGELKQFNQKKEINSKYILKKGNDDDTKFDLKLADKMIQEFNNSAFYKEPTIFEVTKFPHAEIVYSNILAFYFNIKKEHNFGDLIFKAFLKSANIEIGEIKQLNVFPEYLTKKGKRIDLVLCNDDFAIGIENKINAVIYNDLEDYAKTIEGINKNNYKIILSLKDESKIANKYGYINIKYDNFIYNIRNATKNIWDNSNKWHILLQEFMLTIENMKGEDGYGK